jgi:hypothetical protein
MPFESRWGQAFSLLHVVQTGPVVHPPPMQCLPGALSPVVKQPRREAIHPLPTNDEVKKMWIYSSTNRYVFMT